MGFRIKFTYREIEEILISMLLISLAILYSNVGLDLIEYPWYKIVSQLGVLMFSVGLGFILHEMGHKVVAQYYGAEAGFKMWVKGLLFMFLTAIAFGVVFAAPGAVYIRGRLNKDQVGKIGIAGPLMNYILAVGFILMFMIVYPVFGPFALLTEIAFFGMLVNSFLGLFNMLPIPPLDGSKIISWNIFVWALMLISGIVLYGFSVGLIM